jgi:hypothetical protein
MQRRTRNTLFSISTALLLTVGSATATTITSTTFQSWKTTITGTPKDTDFSGVQFRSYNTSAGLSLSVTGSPSLSSVFTGPDNGAFQLSGTSYNGAMGVAGSTDSGAGVNVAPSASQNAFLLSVGSTSGTALTISFSDGESFSISGGLVGFSISHSITSFLVTTTPGSQAVINDLWYGSSSLTQDQAPPANDPSATPEGATLLLVAGGSPILLGARRKFNVPVEG